jgi:hypothetical protein
MKSLGLGRQAGRSKKQPHERLVVTVIANVLGLILLFVVHDAALAAILFVVGAILALYSLLIGLP